MRFGRFLAILAFLLPGISVFSQQWPSTMLWRISGHGLQKPSYLFGTVHLQDKRLFNFPDSLYRAMENTDGFAIEVNFRDYLDTLLQKTLQQKEEGLLADSDKEVVDVKKLGKNADSVVKKLGFKNAKLTRKELKKIRDLRLNQIVQEGDMPTIMDAYLYGIAMRQGKWLGAIEDVHDQLDLVDEIGNDLDTKDVFLPDNQLRFSLEQLEHTYLDQDLQHIEEQAYGKSGLFKDKVLIQRNIKMARRMDSLSALRSMFFAVGAAHLPGDSGVISFLRDKGFTVDPVFCSGKSAASAYAAKLQEISWTQVSDEQNFYTVEMPGSPSDHNMFGDLLKMKMYFDFTTMTCYMCTHTIANAKNEKEMGDALLAIANNGGPGTGKVISKKMIRQNELLGTEGLIENKDGTYRIRILQKDNSMYILVAGSSKKSNLSAESVDRFLNSFRANVPVKKDWVKFDQPGKGFSVSMPGMPNRNKIFEQKADGSNWRFLVYDYADANSGLYFIMQVRDLRQGYYMDADSLYFSQFRHLLEHKMEVVSRDENFMYRSYPALRFDGYSKKENLIYKTFNAIRGNRVYSMIVIGTMTADTSLANQFINSLSFSDYQPLLWERHGSGDSSFSSVVPAPFVKVLPTDSLSHRLHYISYDTSKVVSYEVFKLPLSTFYWDKNDSSFFENNINAYAGEGDSILQKNNCSNGHCRGVEALVKMAGNNYLKKVRLFLNGDTLYTLITFIPPQMVEKESRQFFDDFRVDKEVPSSIFTSKAGKLLDALKTSDSANFEQASRVLNQVEFNSRDLPLLHRALLEKYRDDDSSNNVFYRLTNIIAKLADTSTVSFIGGHYNNLTVEREDLKMEMLEMLARIKTKTSYELLKTLFMQPLPKTGSSASLARHLLDSLALTRNLFPDLLRQSHDSLMREVIVRVARVLIDSSLLDVHDMQPYESIYLDHAKLGVTALSDPDAPWWNYNDWVKLTGKFNDARSNKLLQEFLKAKSADIRMSAVIALAGNNQPIDPKEIEKLANSRDQRIDLFQSLKQIRKEQLFPARLANQRSFAESVLYLVASDDMEVEDMEFLGERIRDIQGKKQKFYLFRIKYNNEDEKGSYLGIAGPYAIAAKELNDDYSKGGIYWKESFKAKDLEKQFNSYLNELEEAPAEK